MRQRLPRLIITFETTAMALRMEKVCHAANIPGRLIPVPREITAGCGLAWMAKPEEKEQIQTAMQEGCIMPQDVHVLGGRTDGNGI